jgi:uncharacterized protein (DUF4415 family)
MSKKSTTTDSLTDWNRIDAMRDEDIDLSDIPEILEAQFTQATLRVKGKSVPKDKIPVLLDADLVAHFRDLAGEKTYLTLINDFLRANVDESSLENLLRRVIREELSATR